MKFIKTRTDFINENADLDDLLDRISSGGIDSLNDDDRRSLDLHSKESTVEMEQDNLKEYLTSKYSYFITHNDSPTIANTINHSILYALENEYPVFNLLVSREVLGVKKPINTLYIDNDLYQELKEKFSLSEDNLDSTILDWFNHNYNQSAKKLDLQF